MMSTHIFIQLFVFKNSCLPRTFAYFYNDSSQEGLLHSKYTLQNAWFLVYEEDKGLLNELWTPGLQAQSIRSITNQ